MSRILKNQSGETTTDPAAAELGQVLLAQTCIGIFIADAQGRYLEVNQFGCEIIGYTRSELLQYSWQDLIPVAEQQWFFDVQHGHAVHQECHLYGKDSLAHPVTVDAQQLADGRLLAFVSTRAYKQTEKALRKQVHIYETLFNQTISSLVLLDRDYRFVRVNQAWARFFQKEVIDFHGRYCLDFLPQDEALHERVLSLFDKVMRTGKPIQILAQPFMFVSRLEPGTTYWDWILEPIFDELGEVEYLFFSANDVTERVQAETSLQESRQRYQEVFEHSSECIFLIDVTPDGRFKFVELNPAEEKAVGLSNAELAGRFVEDTLSPELAQQVIARYRRCVEAATLISYDEELDLPVGLRYFHTSLIPVYDAAGTIYRLVGVARDITERKQAEEMLYKREWEFRALIENSPDFIVRHDRNGRILYANPAVEQLFGIPQVRLLEQTFIELMPTSKGAQQFHDKVMEVVQTGHPVEAEFVQDAVPMEKPPYHHMRFVPECDREGQVISVLSIGRDISALKESERQLRTLMENAPDIISRFDREARYLYVNSAVEKFAGMSASRLIGQPIGESLTKHLSPEVPEAFLSLREVIAQVFITNTAVETEIETLLPIGGKRVFNVRLIPEYNELGKVASVLNISRDITDRTRTEEALRKLSRAVEQSASTIIITDAQSRIEYVNPRFTETSGYTQEEVMGKHTRFLKSGYTPAAEYKRLWRAILDGKEWHGEFQNRRKSGEFYWESASISPIKDAKGVITHFVAVKEDITERKLAEAEREQFLAQIREQAETVQFIMDTVPEGIFLVGEDHYVRLTNSTAQQYLSILAPDWENACLSHLGDRVLVDLLVSPEEGLWHVVSENGRYFEIIARPVADNATTRGWVFVLRDVTQERQIQRQMRDQERLAAVGQLAAGIAHDFNNNLAVIKLYTDILLRTGDLSSRAQERLQVVDLQTQRASNLIQQILDFSRQSMLERQSLNLLPFLKELTSLLARTLPENIQIKLNHTQDDYMIHADVARIQQAVMNLAVNARDAMPEGGFLTINLDILQITSDETVPVPGMSEGSWVRVAVLDNGMGIPAEVFPHIFEPFFTTKAQGKGTGLGLAQVYGIVQQHGGFVHVTTAVAQGTTFSIYFPFFSVEPHSTSRTLDEVLVEGQGEVVLVVEDEAATRRALVDSLLVLNYQVVEAKNGREALATLTQPGDEISLVLSDAVMPEMGGIALLRAMREHKITIPMIMLTGHAVEKDMESLRALGLHSWLAKPPDLSQLAMLLRQALTS